MDSSNYQLKFEPQDFANSYMQILQLDEQQFANDEERVDVYFDKYINAYMKAANWLKDTNKIN